MGRIALVVLVLYAVVVVVAPALPLPRPETMRQSQALQAPSSQHWLGTDQFGRDVLSRTIAGTRLSLEIVSVSAFAGALIGVTSGVVTGFVGGAVSTITLRMFDVLLAFPTLVLAIGIAAIVGPSAFSAALALAVVGVPQFARVTRASVLVERTSDYVAAATSIGARERSIMFRHVLPNVLGPVMVQLTLFMSFAVMIEASLSYLGLGVQPPHPSLGSMLNEGRFYFSVAPWYGLTPGIALTTLVFSLNGLSDAMRDVLDPRALT